jgi:hypothetical protein
MFITAHMENFNNDGLVVLKNIFSENQINEHLRIINDVRDYIDIKDENGFGDRIGQLHQKYTGLMELATNKEILEVLRYALKDEPILFGSLAFEKGSQQDLHVDAIFFWPEPSYSMAGVWVALEDVDLDNGPLMYVPGSHKWKMIRSQCLADRNDALNEKRESLRLNDGKINEGEFLNEFGKIWTEEFLNLVKMKNAEIVKLPIKKGDVVIWHSFLAHGGSPIANKARSRNAMVYHFLGKNTKLFNYTNFAILNDDEFSEDFSEKVTLKKYKDLEYISYPHFVTYNNGIQEVHEFGSTLDENI